jgi:hypothetical protein
LKDVDIAFLQEAEYRVYFAGPTIWDQREQIKTQAGFLTYLWAERARYTKIFRGFGGIRGPAIFSRLLLIDRQIVSVPQEFSTTPLPILVADVDVSGVRYRLMSTHFPADTVTQNRENDRVRVATRIRELMNAYQGPIVFGADTNGTAAPISDKNPALRDAVDSADPGLELWTFDLSGACGNESGNPGIDVIFIRDVPLQAVTYENRCTAPPTSDHPFVYVRFG